MNRYITSTATEMQKIINMIDIFYALLGKKKQMLLSSLEMGSQVSQAVLELLILLPLHLKC